MFPVPDKVFQGKGEEVLEVGTAAVIPNFFCLKFGRRRILSLSMDFEPSCSG